MIQPATVMNHLHLTNEQTDVTFQAANSAVDDSEVHLPVGTKQIEVEFLLVFILVAFIENKTTYSFKAPGTIK